MIMETSTKTITGLAEYILQHRNEQYAFAFATMNALTANDPASFHSVVVWPMENGGFGINIAKCNGTESMSFEASGNWTSIQIHSWLLRYFNFYVLPTSIVVGPYSELIKLSASMTGSESTDSEVVCLNDTLLSLILFIQRSRSYYVSRSEILGVSPDWDREVKRDWDDIPASVFEQAGIKRCSHNLDEMLQFEVTEEILNCEAKELSKFRTPFYAKGD